MAAAIPIISAVAGGLSIGQTLFPGLLGGQADAGAEAPFLEEPQSSVVEDQIISQTARNQELRRQAASKSRKLTDIEENPITEDSLLRIIAGGR